MESFWDHYDANLAYGLSILRIEQGLGLDSFRVVFNFTLLPFVISNFLFLEIRCVMLVGDVFANRIWMPIFVVVFL